MNTNIELEAGKDKESDCKHVHMCEISRYILRVEKLISKRSCEKISFSKGLTKEYKLDDNVIVKVNDSGIYIHIKFV